MSWGSPPYWRDAAAKEVLLLVGGRLEWLPVYGTAYPPQSAARLPTMDRIGGRKNGSGGGI